MIPEPVTASPESIETFKVLLENLFAQYPVVQVYDEHTCSIECRTSALDLTYSASLHVQAHNMYFMACDTGVPNDEIMTAYALLFL